METQQKTEKKSMQEALNNASTVKECVDTVQYLLKCAFEFMKKAEYIQKNPTSEQEEISKEI